MNQANVTHSAGKLFYNLKPRSKLNYGGPEQRMLKVRKTLTALLKYERIEVGYRRGEEVRGYTERLISEAIRHGPENPETMELANFYILEKQLIHKLFKVLVPRYQNYSYNFTKIHKAAGIPVEGFREKSILELRGNIYPSLSQDNPPDHLLLHNILLTEARKELKTKKYKQIAEQMGEEKSNEKND